MSEPDLRENSRIQLTLALVFLAIVTGGVIDLILDRPRSLLEPHALFEIGLIALSLSAAWYLGRGWYSSTSRVGELERAVERREAERDEWRRRAGQTLAGFGSAIARQFDVWNLTPAERETALQILQGYSHKRIARLTDRSERTVRHHAVAVYRKAGLGGRAELAGFFLGDLVLPTPEAGGREAMEPPDGEP